MSDKTFLVLWGGIFCSLYGFLYLIFYANWNEVNQAHEYLFALFFGLMIGSIPTVISVVVLYELREMWRCMRDP